MQAHYKKQRRSLFGKRIVKTSLAVALSIFIAQIFNLESISLSGIAAIITMTHTLSSSFQAAYIRVLGTVVGVSLGYLLQIFRFSNILTIGLGLWILINILVLLKWQDAVVTAGISLISVMLFNPEISNIPLHIYALHNVINTFIGVFIAFLINMFVLPPDQEKFLVYHYQDVLGNFREKVLDLLERDYEIQLSPLVQDLNEITMDTMNSEKESPFIKKNIALAEIWEVNTQFYRAFSLLTQIAQREHIVPLHEKNKEELEDLLGREIYPLQGEPNDKEEEIFNYHVQKFVQTLRVITVELEELTSRIEDK